MSKAKKIQIETNLFESELMTLIKGEFGTLGMVVALQIRMMIEAEGCHIKWDRRTKAKVMGVLPGVDAELIEAVVKALVEFGVYSEDALKKKGELTSKELQARYFSRKRNRQEFDSAPDFVIISDADFDKAVGEEREFDDYLLAKWNARCAPDLTATSLSEFNRQKIKRWAGDLPGRKTRLRLYERVDQHRTDRSLDSWISNLLAG